MVWEEALHRRMYSAAARRGIAYMAQTKHAGGNTEAPQNLPKQVVIRVRDPSTPIFGTGSPKKTPCRKV